MASENDPRVGPIPAPRPLGAPQPAQSQWQPPTGVRKQSWHLGGSENGMLRKRHCLQFWLVVPFMQPHRTGGGCSRTSAAFPAPSSGQGEVPAASRSPTGSNSATSAGSLSQQLKQSHWQTPYTGSMQSLHRGGTEPGRPGSRHCASPFIQPHLGSGGGSGTPAAKLGKVHRLFGGAAAGLGCEQLGNPLARRPPAAKGTLNFLDLAFWFPDAG